MYNTETIDLLVLLRIDLSKKKQEDPDIYVVTSNKKACISVPGDNAKSKNKRAGLVLLSTGGLN